VGEDRYVLGSVSFPRFGRQKTFQRVAVLNSVWCGVVREIIRRDRGGAGFFSDTLPHHGKF